jgi:copper chaperone NosL
MRASLLVWLAGATFVSCGKPSDGPPEIVLDRTVCAHCGMLVSEPAFAAAYRVGGADAKVFDDIACLLNGLEGEETREAVAIWLHDFASSEWIRETSAVFVVDAGFETPMGGGIVAFSDRVAAERAAHERDGRLVTSFDALLQPAETERATR